MPRTAKQKANLVPFPKGASGNPGGMPKMVREARLEILGAICVRTPNVKTMPVEAVQTVAEIMRDQGAKPSDRLKAAEIIINLVMPKKDSVSVEIEVTERKQMIAALFPTIEQLKAMQRADQ